MLKEKIKKGFNIIEKSYISEYAAQCSFFIILSFIPFIILLLTLIQYLGLDKETLFTIISSIIPTDINNTVLDIIQEVYSKSIGTISISIVFILWSAGRGFFALCKGLNSIYKVPKKYNYFSLKAKSLVCTVGFILVIVLTLIILVFGSNIKAFMNGQFPQIAKTTNLFLYMGKLIVFLLSFIIFMLIYRFVPNHKMKFKYQMPGAIFSAVFWYTISKIFSFYVEKTSGFSAIYGSLTTVMLLFIWIYLCIYILLLGAIINKELERGKKNEKNN